MRHAHIALFAIALTLAAVVVSAQCCPPAATEPCCPSSLSSCMPASQAVSAALGAGPAVDLQKLCGADFDKAYLQSMYQLHATIGAFVTQGIEQTSDKSLRDLSVKIRDEQTKWNENLAAWARACNDCPLPVDYSKVQAIVNTLPKCNDCNFNAEYARTLSMLLSQQRDADQLAIANSSIKQLQTAAAASVTSTQKQINSLLKWIGDKQCPQPSCTPACPTTTCPSTPCK
ncbi:MAG: hypothetical protein ABFD49_05600 [Armatimonadota bacterium]|nr:DUF4142 domain-containing protein [bacterium]